MLAVAVTAAGVAYAARPQADAGETPVVEVSTGAVEVTRGVLTQSVQISGALGYTGSYTIDHQGVPGVLTAAAAPGRLVGRGGILFRVADAPVRLLLGSVPAYRDFRYGMTDGPDVRQLEQNLAAMGHDLTVDRHFSAATAAAIRRWQASWGRARHQRTGRLAHGAIVFLPTPLRVTAQQTRVGAVAGSGSTVLTATSTTRAVMAPLDTADREAVHVGDQVEVSLPDRDPIRGRVTGIGQVATSEPGDSNAEPPQPQNTGAATVPVTIAVQLPRGFTLDQAPATVDITTGTHRDVLLIPIVALLARPGGGYQVRLIGGPLARVELGRFDESTGRVEIVSGLTEGQSVEVPGS